MVWSSTASRANPATIQIANISTPRVYAGSIDLRHPSADVDPSDPTPEPPDRYVLLEEQLVQAARDDRQADEPHRQEIPDVEDHRGSDQPGRQRADEVDTPVQGRDLEDGREHGRV